MLDALSRPHPFKYFVLLIHYLTGHKTRNRLSNRFPLRIPVNALRTSIPTHDDSVQILGNDGIVRGLHNGGMSEQGFFCPLFVRDVLHHREYERRWATLQ